MADQIIMTDASVAFDPALDAARGDHTHEVAPDLAYRRLGLVNVAFWGLPDAGDRGWVLIDAGIVGSKAMIRASAEARFGEAARPAAIIMTHGHFDHIGALEDLAEEWNVPVYAHPLERPYLNGTAAYPPGDPSVGGGLMAALSRFYPTRPVDVGSRLHDLPADGSIPSMPGWVWVHTPGHSVGHISLWHELDRTLISGDAIVSTAQESAYAVAVQESQMHGPPQYFTIDWDAAKASVVRLAALEPELILTMHGQPLRGTAMKDALHRLADDFAAIAVPAHGQYITSPRFAEDGSAYEAP